MLEIACLVDAGIRAPENDDRVAINKQLISHGAYSESTETNCLVVICDGVGGYKFGNEAAEIVTGVFSLQNREKLTVNDINEYLTKANKAVLNAQQTDSNHSNMSTTIAGLYITNNDFIAFNIGDSRIYRYRSPYIMQISTDHSEGNVLTRWIGDIHVIPNIVDGTGRVFTDDIYVICSDGVWGVLENDDFENVLSNENNLEEACKTIVSLALQKGSKDNLSIVIIRSS